MKSIPRPPSSWSAPAPPVRKSKPSPPSSRSSPSPPVSVSLSGVPIRVWPGTAGGRLAAPNCPALTPLSVIELAPKATFAPSAVSVMASWLNEVKPLTPDRSRMSSPTAKSVIVSLPEPSANLNVSAPSPPVRVSSPSRR